MKHHGQERGWKQQPRADAMLARASRAPRLPHFRKLVEQVLALRLERDQLNVVEVRAKAAATEHAVFRSDLLDTRVDLSQLGAPARTSKATTFFDHVDHLVSRKQAD